MSAAALGAIAVGAAGLLALAAVGPRGVGRLRRRRRAARPGGAERRILFPFLAYALSARALDAALRLARTEGATLVPVFLAVVSRDLPLDAPLPRQTALCLPMQEAIEQRAGAFGVPVDARIERGRTRRHALARTIATERYERIVVAAAVSRRPGFGAEDIAWLLDHAAGEIVVLRPA